jgi:hypothetical protein
LVYLDILLCQIERNPNPNFEHAISILQKKKKKLDEPQRRLRPAPYSRNGFKATPTDRFEPQFQNVCKSKDLIRSNPKPSGTHFFLGAGGIKSRL